MTHLPLLARWGFLLGGLGPLAMAQVEEARALVRAGNLAPGYAQLLTLSSSPDISTATYQIDSDASRTAIHVMRLPYEDQLAKLGEGFDLRGRLGGGYLKMTTIVNAGLGTVPTRWRAFSLMGGLGLRKGFAEGWSSTLALDGGIARLDNHASYEGGSENLRPLFDGLLFNWQTNAWLVVPSLEVVYRPTNPERGLLLKAHAARSWISSLQPPDPVLGFHESANTFSLEGEQTLPTGYAILGQPLRLLLLGGYSGLFGANRDALGFTAMAKAGGGIETPLPGRFKKFGRLRLSGTYLVASHLRGWTFGLGLAN